jgi:hypothetical protein
MFQDTERQGHIDFIRQCAKGKSWTQKEIVLSHPLGLQGDRYEDRLEMSVQDLNHEDHERLFESFQKLGFSPQRRYSSSQQENLISLGGADIKNFQKLMAPYRRDPGNPRLNL